MRPMNLAGRTLVGLALLLPALALAADQAGDVHQGKLVYERYCLSCHGAAGNGAGEFAEWISPKPRDYRQGTFKWRSTPSGSLPTDADLEKTRSRGLYGTYMPTWYLDRASLAHGRDRLHQDVLGQVENRAAAGLDLDSRRDRE